MLTAEKRAAEAGLTYVDPEELPLRRRRCGRGFAYLDQRSRAVSDARLRQRLTRLMVPPAWKEVKLARDPSSHIQAVGRDRKGRLQYRYHPRWSELDGEIKREKLETLGLKLGTVREHVDAQLRRHTIDKEYALSAAIALLDRMGLRVGYPEYSRKDGGRGATTLASSDVHLKDGTIKLRFYGKGGKQIERVLHDPPLARALAGLKAQPGKPLFRWREEGLDRRLAADDVNAFLKDVFGEATSAKDFRTFRASAIAAGALQPLRETSASQRNAALRQAIRSAAQFLANTPSVAKGSYIHPAVQQAFIDQRFDPAALFAGPVRAGLSRDETTLLRLLSKEA